jgi:tellurite resistance protein
LFEETALSNFQKADVPTTAAALAALLVAADGVIDPREKAVAVSLGKDMFLDFCPLAFETLLNGVDHLPGAAELAAQVRPLLDEHGKVLIMEYLVALAVADDRVVNVEREKLQEVAVGLGTELPCFAPYQVEE